jgi:hypothetical protein
VTAASNTQEQRLERLREVLDRYEVITDSPGVSSTDDLAPYLDGSEPISKWCAITSGSDFQYAYPAYDTAEDAQRKADAHRADVTYAEEPVAVVNLDTDELREPVALLWSTGGDAVSSLVSLKPIHEDGSIGDEEVVEIVGSAPRVAEQLAEWLAARQPGTAWDATIEVRSDDDGSER